MREYFKEKVKNLVALRSNLFTCVIVLTSGIVGLFFVKIMDIYEILSYCALGILVIAFTYVFGSMYLGLKKDVPQVKDNK